MILSSERNKFSRLIQFDVLKNLLSFVNIFALKFKNMQTALSGSGLEFLKKLKNFAELWHTLNRALDF